MILPPKNMFSKHHNNAEFKKVDESEAFISGFSNLRSCSLIVPISLWSFSSLTGLYILFSTKKSCSLWIISNTKMNNTGPFLWILLPLRAIHSVNTTYRTLLYVISLWVYISSLLDLFTWRHISTSVSMYCVCKNLVAVLQMHNFRAACDLCLLSNFAFEIYYQLISLV